MKPPVLVKLPSSHRRNDAVERKLGYYPHAFISFRRDGQWARLPEIDAQKLLESGLATKTRINEAELRGVWYQPDPYRGTPPKDQTCQHSPARLYSWTANDGTLVICCCECGRILKGAVE